MLEKILNLRKIIEAGTNKTICIKSAQKEKLINKLKKINDEGLFKKNNLMWLLQEDEDCISLCFINDINRDI